MRKESVQTERGETEITGVYKWDNYFHIMAVDCSGNPSGIKSYPLAKCYRVTVSLNKTVTKRQGERLYVNVCVFALFVNL